MRKMLSLGWLMVSSEDPEKLASFYRSILDKDEDWKEGVFHGFDVGNNHLVIAPHDKVQGASKEPERIIINFETEDVQAEFDRIRRLGADVVAEPYHPDEEGKMTIATLADPDGNYFQLGSQMEA